MPNFAALGFPNRRFAGVWAAVFLLTVPLATFLRFYHLSQVLLEPHPSRQLQTAVTTLHFYQRDIGFLNYASPLDGKLWNLVYEFPLYQWLSAQVMRTGVGIETASRLVTLFFFLVGAVSLFRIAERLLNRHVALWSVLFFYVSPYTVIYSRTSLIDFTALAFQLISLDAFLGMLASPRVSVPRWGIAFLAGTLASVVKVTVWFGPTALLFLYAAWRGFRGLSSKPATAAVLSALCVQLAGAIAWIEWTNHLRWHASDAGLLGNELGAWILGPLALRLSVSHWHLVLTTLGRLLLHDWMLPSFLAALSLAREFRDVALFGAGLCLISVLVTFNVHAVHDYYFIGESPYLFAIAAIGFVYLLENCNRRSSQILLAMTVLFFTVRLTHTRFTYSAMLADREVDAQPYRILKNFTDPKELVYVEGGHFDWEWPFFSERLVVLGDRVKQPGLSPNAFHFKSEPQTSRLAPFSRVWLDGAENDFLLYRVREAGRFVFDPARHVSVDSSLAGAAPPFVPSPNQTTIDACRAPVDLKMPPDCRSEGDLLTVKWSDTGRTVWLPARAYLHLPNRSRLGCRFEIQCAPQLASKEKKSSS